MRDVEPPTRPWAGQMRWCDLAFLHWPIRADLLRPLVPDGLQIDTYDGSAWLGVVPFRMEGVRVRAAPPVPTAHAFAEINVRTYVRGGGRAGVWFFSLDAASRLAVRGARFLYHLPYFDAAIDVVSHESRVEYRSVRRHRGAPPAEFAGRYQPIGAAYEAAPGTLDHFLVERYCLFMHDARRGLGRLDIDHAPWTLFPGEAAIGVNSMTQAVGLDVGGAGAIVHVAGALDVRAWTRSEVAAAPS